MSYCRFSSDDWRSDVYVYESVDGGYVIDIASSKVTGDIPRLPVWQEVTAQEFVDAVNAQMNFLENAPRELITLPYVGGNFNEPTLHALFFRLVELRDLGYRIPEHVFVTLKEEMNDAESKSEHPE